MQMSATERIQCYYSTAKAQKLLQQTLNNEKKN